MDENLTVREVGEVLGRSRRTLVVIPATVVLAMTGFVLLGSKKFSSQASVSFAVSSQQLASQQVTAQLLANLPSPALLASAFSQTIATTEMSAALGAGFSIGDYGATYDEKKFLLTLRARGKTAEEARARAEKLLRVAQKQFQERLVAAATANLKSALAQTRLDLSTARKGLADVQKILGTMPHQSGSVSPTTSAALEALKVDPQWARSGNPAYTYLSLQEAQLQSQLIQAQARAESLEELQRDQQALSNLVGQSLQVQVVAPPSTALWPDSPRPARDLVLAAAFGIILAVALAFFRDAWHRPGRPGDSA